MSTQKLDWRSLGWKDPSQDVAGNFSQIMNQPAWNPTAAQQTAQPVQPAQPAAQPVDKSLSTEQIMGAQQGINPGAKGMARIEMPSKVETPSAITNKQNAEREQFVLDQLIPTISPEEQRKREQSATAIKGVAALGNGISALSNLIFAGQAPSQTLPSIPDESGEQMMTWQDRLKNDRLQRNALQMQFDQERLKMAQQDWENRMAERAQAASEKQQDWARQYQIQKDKQEQANKDREYNLAVKQQADLASYRSASVAARGNKDKEDLTFTVDPNTLSEKRGEIIRAIGDTKAIEVITANDPEAVIQGLSTKDIQKLADAGVITLGTAATGTEAEEYDPDKDDWNGF